MFKLNFFLPRLAWKQVNKRLKQEFVFFITDFHSNSWQAFKHLSESQYVFKGNSFNFTATHHTKIRPLQIPD